MTIYDISLPISPELPVWPGDPAIVLEQGSSTDAGAHDNVSRLACSVHTGTHVDAPHHFLNNHRTVEMLSLDVLTGPTQVVRIPDDVKAVTADVLDNAGVRAGTERLLIRSANSGLWKNGQKDFFTGFVGITADGAEWLVEKGIKLVGIDYLSVAPYKQSVPTHRILLEAGMVILEGVDLSAIQPGNYNLFCLPLKLVGSDGAPARAILMD